MSNPNYSYEDLIKAFFRTIGNRTSIFSTEKCRKFVKENRNNFNDEKFLRSLAGILADMDDQLSDYSDEANVDDITSYSDTLE